MEKQRIVVAIGGNALQSDTHDASAQSQLAFARETARPIGDLIAEGHEIIIVHGNGPQVGQILSVFEKTSDMPVMPLPESVAMSQGYIGYHLQQAIGDEARRRGFNKNVVTVLTQVKIDRNDETLGHPTKPIGSFYSREDAEELARQNGFVMIEDAGRGWRRVVDSPKPVEIVESDAIRSLIEEGHVVIASGGGGVPVNIQDNGQLHGVAAVIDKDWAAERLAELLNADYLIILTGVDRVAINYRKSNQRELGVVTSSEAKQYVREGQFEPGSMLPKVSAAIRFVESKPGRRALITSIDKAKEAMLGTTGTTFVTTIAP